MYTDRREGPTRVTPGPSATGFHLETGAGTNTVLSEHWGHTLRDLLQPAEACTNNTQCAQLSIPARSTADTTNGLPRTLTWEGPWLTILEIAMKSSHQGGRKHARTKYTVWICMDSTSSLKGSSRMTNIIRMMVIFCHPIVFWSRTLFRDLSHFIFETRDPRWTFRISILIAFFWPLVFLSLPSTYSGQSWWWRKKKRVVRRVRGAQY